MTNLVIAGAACVAMFSADPGPAGLYVTDGTRGNTKKLRTLGDVAYITPTGNGAMMSGIISTKGRELLISRGTTGTTTIVRDIYTGSQSSDPRTHKSSVIGNAWDNEYRYAMIGNRIIFGAEDAQRGYELRYSVGTGAGTGIIRDFASGTSDGLQDILGQTDTYALVVAEDDIRGRSFWATDGTSAGTRYLTPELDGLNGSQTIEVGQLPGNKMLFTQSKGNSLWVTDGTRVGTKRIRAFHNCADGTAFRHIRHMKGFPTLGYALFSGCTNALGHELWRSDGTLAGTKLVRNINIGQQSSEPTGFYRFGGAVLFSAISDAHGRELWRTSGTKASTSLIRNIRSGQDSSSPRWFRRFGTKVVFGAQIDGFGRDRLFSTDLTPAGTRQLGNVIIRSPLANIGTKLVFSGGFLRGNVYDDELMGTLGLPGTTSVVKNIEPGPTGFASSQPRGIVALRINGSGYATPANCPAQ